MEERATEKQIEFAKKLGIQGTERLTKHTVRELIKAKLEEGNGDQKYSKAGYTPSTTDAVEYTSKFGAPVEKVPYTIEHEGSPPPLKTTKEYHLSPEQVRSNALASAIEQGEHLNMKELLLMAKEFDEWINGN